jgi:hypothetical protein
MDTPGTDEPQPTASGGPTPPPAAAPRPASGPSSSGIPVERSDEPVAVGDPTTGATATAAITPPPIPPPPAPPTGGGPGAGGLGGDWPAQATDAIVNAVGAVRDRTTGPITTAARGLVFGLFAGVLGLVVAVLGIIAVVRILDVVLPSGIWLPYLVLGAVFVLAGALVFRKRLQPAPAGNTRDR